MDTLITLKELNKALRRTKTGGACGADSIHYEMLKWAPLSLKQSLLKLFNTVLDTGKVPKIWRYAIIAALYKNKGDPFMPINYSGWNCYL